ncbi:MAG: electron transfer flavoprotein subunit beta/FixA family protein, partial [Myxococcota bacterium]
SIGPAPTALLKHAAALGADEIVAIEAEPLALDPHAIARVLSAWIDSSGGADLILCGRQASDDDQGVVPALMAERLGVPLVAVARAVALADGTGEEPELEVTRVTPDGDEVVRVRCPAIVTISNELGEPRFPNTARKLRARRMKPTVVAIDDLGLGTDALQPRATVLRQLVPAIQGHCEFLSRDTPAQTAQLLIARLREDRLLAPPAEGARAS